MDIDPLAPPTAPAMSPGRLQARREQVLTTFLQGNRQESADAASAPARATRPLRLALVGTTMAAVAAGAIFLATPSTTFTAAHRDSAGQAITTKRDEPKLRPAAFTITKNGNGSVTFTAHDLVDTDAATKALNDAGIAGRVVNANTQACSATAIGSNADGALLALANRKGTNTVTFTSSSYPAGGGMLIVVNPNTTNTWISEHVWLMVLVYNDSKKFPNC